MKENVTIEKYIFTKNIIYQLYPFLVELSDDDLANVFSNFGRLEEVARNTYYFPYDIDLLKDMENLSQEQIFDGHLEQKYKLSRELLKFKYNEYCFYDLNGLMSSSDLLDKDSMQKFNYQEKLQKGETDISNLPKK